VVDAIARSLVRDRALASRLTGEAGLAAVERCRGELDGGEIDRVEVPAQDLEVALAEEPNAAMATELTV
jgi:hypothetical protein